MKAFAPVKEQSTAAGVRARPVSATPVMLQPEMLQRKADCACGGGCPRCAQKTSKDGPPAIQRKCSCGGSCPSCSVEEEPGLQMKPAVNEPGDVWEQEADRVADSILSMPAPIAHREANNTPQISRKSAGTPAAAPRHVPPGVSAALQSGGRPLDAATRSYFEPRLGRDLTNVRLHTGVEASRSAQELHALAYTAGSHIVFRDDQYAPWSTEGRRLLAHELVHTIQQNSADGDGLIRRRWDGATECAGQPTGDFIKEITVDQATPQKVTVTWDKAGDDPSKPTSTGKGHCCVEPGSAAGGTCSEAESRIDGTNCTPVGTKLVVNRVRDHGGVEFWSEIDPARAIALHEYSPVDGTPLSHGCIRLNHADAVRIFCGVRQNVTKVKIVNVARPMCDTPSLQKEWKEDFDLAGQTLAGADGETTRQIQEARREMNAAFGRTVKPSEFSTFSVPKDIPRCRLRTVEEEAAADKGTKAAPSAAEQSITGAGFDTIVSAFEKNLKAAFNVAKAKLVVNDSATKLWERAVARAQGATANTDDRPRYWAQERMMGTLRTWKPAWGISVRDLDMLLRQFEDAARGRTTAAFTSGVDTKKILISGFDPFGITAPTGNPSGAAVLALDGRTLSNAAGASAEVQGVIFPVRFRDFDQGVVENFFGPYIQSTTPPNMILTISQGGTGFEVEEFAGKTRSTAPTDNEGVTGTGAPKSGVKDFVVPPNLDAGTQPEFIRTTLPTAEMRKSLGRGPKATPEEANVTDTSSTSEHSPPATGALALEGSGGSFLSNEIFYRVALLRIHNNQTLPTGHLHVPALSASAGAAALTTARDSIVSTVEKLLIASIDKI